MKNLFKILIINILTFVNVHAQVSEPTLQDFSPAPSECISKERRQAENLQLKQNEIEVFGSNYMPLAVDPVKFDWVMRQRGVNDNSYYGISFFVDLDNTAVLKDYTCGTRTYNGHLGTDFFTYPYPWHKIDNNNVEAIAGAPGVILNKLDGAFDRQCTNDPNRVWNAVYVRHADGTTALYGHLKSGSLTTKAIGQAVEKGEYLGIVASSGDSSGPHLHFEVRNSTNTAVLDPFNGTCNTNSSMWLAQRPYFEPKILKIMTHSVAPPTIVPCNANPVDNINEKTNFLTGETVYFGIYYRDMLAPQVSQFKLYKPNGVLANQWSYTAVNNANFSATRLSYNLPVGSETGTWRLEITLGGQVYECFYNVNTTAQKFESSELIAANNKLQFTSNTIYDSGKSIILSPGFGVEKGSIFKAQIDGCGGN
jgi:hypothetical protein